MVGIILLGWNLIAKRFDLVGYRPDFAVFGVLVILFLQSTILQLSLASHMMHQYSVGSVAAMSVGKLLAYRRDHALRDPDAARGDSCRYRRLWLGYILLSVALLAAARNARRSRRGAFTSRLPNASVSTRYAVYNHLNDASSLLRLWPDR